MNDHSTPYLRQYPSDQGGSQGVLTDYRRDLTTQSRTMSSSKFDHTNQRGGSAAIVKAPDSTPVDNYLSVDNSVDDLLPTDGAANRRC
jgi:hypothetical protein